MILRPAILVILLCCLMIVASVLGGDAGRETPFVSVGAGARSIGMGGGLTSLVADASAIHYNPAGLASLQFQEIAFMHSLLLEGSTYDFASWVYPITENHGFGGGVMRVGTDDIIRRVDFADRGRFDYAYTQLMLAYGRNVGDWAAAGVALKIVNLSIDHNSDFGVGLDFGFEARVYKNLHLGMVARDILQPELLLETVSEKTPMAVTGGLSLRDLVLSEQARLAVTFDVEKYDDREVRIQAGTELLFHDRFALRLGYGRDDIAFGVGLKSGMLKIDYAYKLVDYVSDLHHLSVSFLLGKSMAERIEIRQLALQPPEPTDAEKRFAKLVEQGNYFFHRFQLDSAGVYFQQALELEPNSENVIGTLAVIEESRRVQQAQEDALQAARTDASQTLASFAAQAERLFAQSMYRAALDLLSLIFDIDPGYAQANELRLSIEEARDAELFSSFDRARQAVDESQWSVALEAYDRVLELDPANAAAQTAKDQVLARIGLPERIRLAIQMFESDNIVGARTRFRAILDVNPEEPVALDYLRRISTSRSAKPKPAATLEELQKDRTNWELYLEGLRHMRNRDYRLAIEAWEKVLKVYPDNQSTLDNIEQARLRLGAEETDN